MSGSEQRRIVLDIGGSSIKSGRVCGREVLGFREDPYDTGADGRTVLSAYRQVLNAHLAAADYDIGGVVLAHPGPFDYERGICLVRGVAKLEGLYGVDIGAALGPDLPAGCDIRFVNDADAAIRGEARFGAGRSYRRLIGVTLGTGFGSAYVEDGEIIRRGEGVAGEGELYNLPWRDGIADEHFSTRGLIESVTVQGFTDRDLHDLDAERYAEGLAAFGRDLGEFLAPLATAFSAECVLVLGGIANLYPHFGPALESRLPVRPLRGELGANAPLLGA